MLEVKNLHVTVEDKEILKGVDLKVDLGKLVVVMGPNAGGKSTLAYTIMGREGYEVTDGDIIFNGESILELDTDERARLGLFLAVQEPPPLPGVKGSLLIPAVIKRRRNLPMDNKLMDIKILREVRPKLDSVGLDSSYMGREVNVGFSGGEKKRFELFQALAYDPKVVILDEPDSGLDVDGVKLVARLLDEMRNSGKGVLLITHNPRLLHFVEPDEVNVLIDGKIVKRGGMEVAEFVEKYGYEKVVSG